MIVLTLRQNRKNHTAAFLASRSRSLAILSFSAFTCQDKAEGVGDRAMPPNKLAHLDSTSFKLFQKGDQGSENFIRLG